MCIEAQKRTTLRQAPERWLYYSFFIWLPADFSINFLVPTVSNATSSKASPPMGRTDMTMPFPNAVCSTISPLFSCMVDAAGAAVRRVEASGF